MKVKMNVYFSFYSSFKLFTIQLEEELSLAVTYDLINSSNI